MLAKQFSIETEDGITRLCGEVAVPDDATHSRGALVIVPGGWFMERDGFTGNSYTTADLMYLRIARRVIAEGFAVIRYDNRGVSGNELSIGLGKDGPDARGDTERYFRTCVDSEARQTVTPETLASDAERIYQYVAKHPAVDPSNIVVFAHSEGGLHVARLIGRNRINPKGVVFAGVSTESPKEVLKWQMIDRYVEEMMGWDRNGNGTVSQSDVVAAYESSFVGDIGLTEEELYPPNESWSESELRAYFTARYESEKNTALEIADDLPFPQPQEGGLDFVAASNRWWKQWFLDDTSMIELLGKYQGSTAFHLGEIDSQLPVQRAIQYLNANADSMMHAPKAVLHPSRGHALRSSEPMSGPMDQEAESIVVEEITQMLRAE